MYRRMHRERKSELKMMKSIRLFGSKLIGYRRWLGMLKLHSYIWNTNQKPNMNDYTISISSRKSSNFTGVGNTCVGSSWIFSPFFIKSWQLTDEFLFKAAESKPVELSFNAGNVMRIKKVDQMLGRSHL